jgi:hypothetical protein
MKPTRRRTLRALGATAAIASAAGCLSGDSPGEPSPNDRNGTDDAEDGTETGGDDVTVGSVGVRPELVTLNSPDSYGTYGSRSSQWVVVELAVETPDDHPPASFAVEAGGETFQAVTDVGEGNGFLAAFDGAYGRRGNGEGWLAARLPKPLGAESATLTWDGGAYEFDGSVLERLRRRPATFEVSFDAPASATVGETVTATVTAENAGDVDGTFVGALNRVGPLVAYAPEAAVVLEVGAGETERWTFSHDLDESLEGREDPKMRLHLLWDDERVSREVGLERRG